MSSPELQQKSKGFTLIELMITVAIIGVISAIAFPSYTAYVTRGKRTECRSAVMQVMQQQERYYTQQNTYTTTTSISPGFLTFSGDSQTSSACTLTAGQCTSTVVISSCVKVTGSPVKADAEVGDITFQSDGSKSCTGSGAPAKCWK